MRICSLLFPALLAFQARSAVPPGFPRELSPKAAKIYDAVMKNIEIRPQYSPIKKQFVAASGRYLGQILDYGNLTTFVADKTSGYRKLIMEAEEEVLLATYILAKDNPTADGVKGALIELNQRIKQQRGNGAEKPASENDRVRVYVSMDPVGAEVFARQPAPLRAHLSVAADIDPDDYNFPKPSSLPYLDFKVRSHHRGALGVMHDKFMVIDGKQVLMGSKNVEGDICEEYMLHLDGSVAFSMREQFKQSWGKEIPDLKRAKPIVAPRPDVKGEFPVIVMGRVEGDNILSKSHKSPQVTGWLKALEVAQKSVYIQTLNFCTKRAVDRVLEMAAKGIQVTIVTSYSYQDVWEQLHRNSYGSDVQVANMMYEKLDPKYHKNLRVCWWMGSRIKGADPKPFEDEWTHTKAMIIDDEIAIIGSANMDPSSWYHQHEFNVAIDDVPTTKLIRDKLYHNQRSLQFCYHGAEGKKLDFLKLDKFARVETKPQDYGHDKWW